MTHCFQKFIFAIILVAATAATPGTPAKGWRKISVNEARHLVYEVAKVHNRGAEIRRIENAYDRNFYYFEVLVPNPVASPVVGHFAVNLRTGDVWDPAACEELTRPSLKKLQEGVRKRLGLKGREFARAKSQKPICAND